MKQNYQIIFRKNALSDLKEIVDFIKLHSPQNAKHVKEKIIQRIESLKTFPYKYHLDFFHPLSHTSKQYRYLSVWSFQIHYKIEKDKIYILKIIYGGKNPDSITTDLNDMKV